MNNMTPAKYLWLAGGLLSLSLGIVGIITPILPTVPFVLLSAYCFANSSKKWHDWMLEHRHFGPMIRDWRENGRIPRNAKYLATASIVGSILFSLFLGFPTMVITIQGIALLGALIFIWSRPD